MARYPVARSIGRRRLGVRHVHDHDGVSFPVRPLQDFVLVVDAAEFITLIVLMELVHSHMKSRNQA